LRRPPGLKQRLDLLLVARLLAESRERAQALILAGRVEVEGKRAVKAGERVDTSARLVVFGPEHPFVGRGGVKLAGALDCFAVRPAGRVALDVGASTGGFTDCLLQRGALRVYALDVGSGQLHYRLRKDPRVVVMEHVNARELKPADLPEPVSILTVDVSFISLRLILPALVPFMSPATDLVALVKPQFEVGRERVGKHGIVDDPAAWDDVLASLVAFAAASGLGPQALARSEVPGATGNVEFFLHLRPGASPAPVETLDAQRRAAVDGRHP
jgi:23S rRNA (cytidine1920-2'-O)/16S rRNA (cytidine1409-2'-O)-methyltransferase